MPRAAKLCSHPDCPNLQPCPTHPKQAWAGSNRRRQLPPDWERRRRAVLARDPICKVCDNALSTEVDHVDDPHDHRHEKLQGICGPCHTDKTQCEAAHARRTR